MVGRAWGVRKWRLRLRRVDEWMAPGGCLAPTKVRRSLDAASTQLRRDLDATEGHRWSLNTFCVLLVHFSLPVEARRTRPPWSLHAASTHSAYYWYTFRDRGGPLRPSPTWRFIILKGSRRASAASRPRRPHDLASIPPPRILVRVLCQVAVSVRVCKCASVRAMDNRPSTRDRPIVASHPLPPK